MMATVSFDRRQFRSRRAPQSSAPSEDDKARMVQRLTTLRDAGPGRFSFVPRARTTHVETIVANDRTDTADDSSLAFVLRRDEKRVALFAVEQHTQAAKVLSHPIT
jgi:hypothetical protein